MDARCRYGFTVCLYLFLPSYPPSPSPTSPPLLSSLLLFSSSSPCFVLFRRLLDSLSLPPSEVLTTDLLSTSSPSITPKWSASPRLQQFSSAFRTLQNSVPLARDCKLRPTSYLPFTTDSRRVLVISTTFIFSKTLTRCSGITERTSLDKIFQIRPRRRPPFIPNEQQNTVQTTRLPSLR